MIKRAYCAAGHGGIFSNIKLVALISHLYSLRPVSLNRVAAGHADTAIFLVPPSSPS
jgi:hypothetical protein